MKLDDNFEKWFADTIQFCVRDGDKSALKKAYIAGYLQGSKDTDERAERCFNAIADQGFNDGAKYERMEIRKGRQ